MSKKPISKFFLSIVVPTFLAIILFVVSFYIVLIPMFEKSIMERKKEMILELTNTAWSVLDEYNFEFENGMYSLEQAQQKAITQIEKMRYGNQRKDYFWIIDHQPKMIMHPYRKELNNTDLSNYLDSHENRLFKNAVEVVDSLGQGFVEYYWQWKDDVTKDVPKLSFVKGFEKWNWIVGTGIYLEDVSLEISALKKRLFSISSIIISIIVLTLIYLIRQSLIIEKKRQNAEEGLNLSRLKYKSLVEASTEGTLMFLNEKVIFANQKFVENYFNPDCNVIGLTFNELFKIDIETVLAGMNDPDKSFSFETQIINSKSETEIVISVSKVSYTNNLGYIVIVKNVDHQKQIEISSKKLSDEVESSLQLMNQSIEPFIKEVLYCETNTTIQEACKLMEKKNERVVFIRLNQQVIGVVNSDDLKNRVLAQGIPDNRPISEVMTSPVFSIHSGALLYEAVLSFKSKTVSHLLVKDEGGSVTGVVSNQDCLEVQRNSLSYLIQQINNSETIKQLKELYSQLPTLISALVSSSDNINHITRLITTVSDSISCRVIQLGIDQMGNPPCKFAFIAMGSAGRSEQTLKTDQDNAIIYEDGFESTENYFLKLANYINKNLNTIGYNNCKGFFMANNPKWCKTLGAWKAYFSRWILKQDGISILDSAIFFDLKYIYGYQALVSELRNHFIAEAKENTLFLYHLANSIINYKAAFENKSIDLKMVMLPIIGYLRINTLYAGIDETNSMNRLAELFEHKVVDFKTHEEIKQTFEYLTHQRIKLQVNQIHINENPENEIHEEMLTSIDLSIIKKILKQIQGLQNSLSNRFKSAE
ncbi:MAG: DUF294 nucleotidyltransferase-like domain-containing protein [Bacteroidales bacterium]|nr:DUF294 nucleotidyltransferase-like domain-containing protein [Bacteroidales bacterium]